MYRGKLFNFRRKLLWKIKLDFTCAFKMCFPLISIEGNVSYFDSNQNMIYSRQMFTTSNLFCVLMGGYIKRLKLF